MTVVYFVSRLPRNKLVWWNKLIIRVITNQLIKILCWFIFVSQIFPCYERDKSLKITDCFSSEHGWCLTCHWKSTNLTFSWQFNLYEGVSKNFRTGHLERELQMVELSTTKCSCIAILWVSLVNFTAITLYVAPQRVFIVAVVVYFVMTQSGNFWIQLHVFLFISENLNV